MKLYKRGRVWVVEFYQDGRRYRKSTGESDKAAARERATGIIAGLKRATGRCDWTLADSLHDTYERIWREQKSAVHVWNRIMKVERDYREWSKTFLPDITYDWLIGLTTEMEKRGMKDATINRYLALFSKTLVEAVKRGKIEVKPPLPYRKESKGKLRWITKAEEAALLDKADELWPVADATALKSLIVVLVDTGARLSEVRKCPRHSVGQVTFTDTKNGLSRSVPLTARAQAALPNVPVWTVMQCIGRFSRLRDACELHDVSLHTLRHTCASRLVQAGMDLYRVKEWLGHSSITVTQRYAHLSPSHLSQGADLLSHFQD